MRLLNWIRNRIRRTYSGAWQKDYTIGTLHYNWISPAQVCACVTGLQHVQCADSVIMPDLLPDEHPGPKYQIIPPLVIGTCPFCSQAISLQRAVLMFNYHSKWKLQGTKVPGTSWKLSIPGRNGPGAKWHRSRKAKYPSWLTMWHVRTGGMWFHRFIRHSWRMWWRRNSLVFIVTMHVSSRRITNSYNLKLN